MSFQQILIEFSKQQIEKKFGRGNLQDLNEKDFRNLAEEIYSTSSIKLSYRTLSRLFGPESQGNTSKPQKATREALARYLDYTDWDSLTKDFEDNHAATFKPSSIGTEKNKRNRYLLFILIGLVLVGVSLWGNALFDNKKEFQLSRDLTYTWHSPSGANAVDAKLYYRVENDEAVDLTFESGNVYKLGRGYVTSIPLDKKEGEFTYSYIFPDFYRPYIITKDSQRIDLPKVLVKSNGWKANVTHSSLLPKGHFYKYFPQYNPYQKDSGFYAISSGFLEKHLDPSFKVAYTEFRITDDSLASGDSLTIELEAFNDDYAPAHTFAGVTILGKCENGNFKAKYISKGGSKFAELTVSEKKNTGKSADLSNLVSINRGWQKLKIKIRNNKMEVFKNNRFLVKQDYELALGSLKSFELILNGSGKMRNVFLNRKELK